MGISGRPRRGAELNWVASTDVGVGLVCGGTSRCTRHPVGPSHVCHMHVFMSGLSGGVPGEVFRDQLGRNVGGIEQPVGAAALLYPLDASTMLGMHMHHPYNVSNDGGPL
jgi:hypothetical protein